MGANRLTTAGSILGLAGAVLFAGCNLFSDLHHNGIETNPHVLVADGNAALQRGDYKNALIYFSEAMANDPRDSEARVGYASAYLWARGFNLKNFINTIMTNSSGGGSSTPTLINPADWGCATGDFNCTSQLFTNLINALDPIALGLTQGPVPSTDVNVNLNVGFFYALRMASRVQQFSATYQLQQFTKPVTAAQLGITDPAQVLQFNSIYGSLPDTFWWVTNGPTTAQLNSLQNDIDSGIARLRTAAQYSSSPKGINDVINLFVGLQNQAHL